MELQTQRLTIRRYTPSDWKDLHEYLSQKEIVKYEPYDVFTEEQSREEAKSRSENQDFWAVCLRENGKVIGNLYLAPQEFETWEIGYVFNRDYQKQGYAVEAARTLLDYIFKEKNARRIVAMCNPDNAASWRLLERLGLRREGHLKQSHYFKTDEFGNPIWADTYEYGILAEEWSKPTGK